MTVNLDIFSDAEVQRILTVASRMAPSAEYGLRFFRREHPDDSVYEYFRRNIEFNLLNSDLFLFNLDINLFDPLHAAVRELQGRRFLLTGTLDETPAAIRDFLQLKTILLFAARISWTLESRTMGSKIRMISRRIGPKKDIKMQVTQTEHFYETYNRLKRIFEQNYTEEKLIEDIRRQRAPNQNDKETKTATKKKYVKEIGTHTHQFEPLSIEESEREGRHQRQLSGDRFFFP